MMSFSSLLAQFKTDTAYIRSFPRLNDVEVYSGFNNTVFHFRHLSDDNLFSHHKLFANTSANMGVTFDYNWLSINYSKNLPGTSVSNHSASIRALGLNLRKTKNYLFIEAGTQKFKGLVLPLNRRLRQFEDYNDINYRSYSFRCGYIFNAKKFSLRAANNFSVMQVKSAGSFILSTAALFQKFKLTSDISGPYEQSDSSFLNTVRKDPRTFNILYNLGYTYNFIFDRGKWSINPGIFCGTGFQKSLFGERENGIKSITAYQLILNAGHNGSHFYYYLSARYDRLYNHIVNSDMATRNDGISLTVGYRVGKMKHKIMGLLYTHSVKAF